MKFKQVTGAFAAGVAYGWAQQYIVEHGEGSTRDIPADLFLDAGLLLLPMWATNQVAAGNEFANGASSGLSALIGRKAGLILLKGDPLGPFQKLRLTA